ncbi:metalloregulator ArsR/SmtB family transcription factor [Candidatus Woesearchaeota archaeon]|nr:metalloregulator ArsR/SmtB family transcription factor [Candidatus Woesearchaeota archaeon]MCF7901060.1 metalloregulator ArsR/SmtB family transcription factor [Candidatus Woesearchaeota archaeon]MCF8013957.1 metalloregulator ArsR/SmtB family transcription factor [Candidatus Woesearchaeota archaeon]
MKCHSYTDFFSNLANESNIKIIESLKTGPKNVTKISNETEIEQSATSHRLKKLVNCNVLNVERKGKERIYSLNKETITPILKLVDEHVHKKCKTCWIKEKEN